MRAPSPFHIHLYTVSWCIIYLVCIYYPSSITHHSPIIPPSNRPGSEAALAAVEVQPRWPEPSKEKRQIYQIPLIPLYVCFFFPCFIHVLNMCIQPYPTYQAKMTFNSAFHIRANGLFLDFDMCQVTGLHIGWGREFGAFGGVRPWCEVEFRSNGAIGFWKLLDPSTFLFRQ